MEKSYEIKRDSWFQNQTQLPTPFPLQMFAVEPLTYQQCLHLGSGHFLTSGPAVNVVFVFEAFRDLAMVQRSISRLELLGRHAFVVHFATDVKPSEANPFQDWAQRRSQQDVCVITGGYIEYLSATDLV